MANLTSRPEQASSFDVLSGTTKKAFAALIYRPIKTFVLDPVKFVVYDTPRAILQTNIGRVKYPSNTDPNREYNNGVIKLAYNLTLKPLLIGAYLKLATEGVSLAERLYSNSDQITKIVQDNYIWSSGINGWYGITEKISSYEFSEGLLYSLNYRIPWMDSPQKAMNFPMKMFEYGYGYANRSLELISNFALSLGANNPEVIHAAQALNEVREAYPALEAALPIVLLGSLAIGYNMRRKNTNSTRPVTNAAASEAAPDQTPVAHAPHPDFEAIKTKFAFTCSLPLQEAELSTKLDEMTTDAISMVGNNGIPNAEIKALFVKLLEKAPVGNQVLRDKIIVETYKLT